MSEPVYKQIEKYLLNLIQTEELKPGDFIPTEVQLSDQFKVTRMTVRSALNNLVREGYIVRQRGVGSRVSQRNVVDDISVVRGFTEEMSSRGIVVSNIIVSLCVIEASEKIKEKLQLEKGSNVWEIKRVRLADDKRVSYMTTYMPVEMFPNLKRSDCEESLYSYIESEYKQLITTSDRKVRAVISDEEIMQHLNLQEIEPLLQITQISKLADCKIFEYSHTYNLGYTLTLSANAK